MLQNNMTITSIFQLLGETQSKSYFSYKAFFKDNVMFALYKEGHLYLRKSEKYLEEISQQFPIYYLTDPKSKLKEGIFFHIPSSFEDQMPNYIHWIQSAIEEYNLGKNQKEKVTKDKIRTMLNLNLNIERILSKIEIYTSNELISLGAVNTYARLIENGSDVSPILLFKLHAAIKRKLVYLLSEEEKQALLAQADNALFELGLRKRFNTKSKH